MEKKPSTLDVDELLMLTARAIGKNDSKQAMDYVGRVLELAPENAQAYHLLGGLHASSARVDQAVAALTRALDLDPQLSVARFQLGLLQLTSGRIAEAAIVWHPLDSLGEDHPLHLFKRGMLHLIRDEFTQCVDDLERGISLNSENHALNKDMRKVMERARRAIP